MTSILTFNQVVSGSSPEWLRQRKTLKIQHFKVFLFSQNCVILCYFVSFLVSPSCPQKPHKCCILIFRFFKLSPRCPHFFQRKKHHISVMLSRKGNKMAKRKVACLSVPIYAESFASFFSNIAGRFYIVRALECFCCRLGLFAVYAIDRAARIPCISE